MNAKISRHAQHGAALVEEPGIGLPCPALRAAMAKGGVEGQDLADCALRDQAFGFAMGGGHALIMPHQQAHACAAGGHQHILAVLRGHGQRLFAQHMLAALHGHDGRAAVIGIGAAYADRVDIRIQQRFHAVKGFAAVLLGHGLRAGGIYIIEARNLAAGVFAVFRRVAHAADLPTADNAYT